MTVSPPPVSTSIVVPTSLFTDKLPPPVLITESAETCYNAGRYRTYKSAQQAMMRVKNFTVHLIVRNVDTDLCMCSSLIIRLPALEFLSVATVQTLTFLYPEYAVAICKYHISIEGTPVRINACSSSP